MKVLRSTLMTIPLWRGHHIFVIGIASRLWLRTYDGIVLFRHCKGLFLFIQNIHGNHKTDSFMYICAIRWRKYISTLPIWGYSIYIKCQPLNERRPHTHGPFRNDRVMGHALAMMKKKKLPVRLRHWSHRLLPLRSFLLRPLQLWPLQLWCRGTMTRIYYNSEVFWRRSVIVHHPSMYPLDGVVQQIYPSMYPLDGVVQQIYPSTYPLDGVI